VASGDVNNDGYDDIVFSAPQGDQGASNTGSVYVVYGKATGWLSSQDVNNTFLNGAGTALNGFRLDGEEASNHIGTGDLGYPNLAVGDINGDGKGDIMIISRFRPSSTYVGSTYLVYGQNSTKWQVSQSLSTLLE
jgi:hypothetical protein